MARNYNVWFMENNSRAYLDSGSKTVHDGHGHDLYRYRNGNLLPVSGDGSLVIKSDGRILNKTGNQIGFVTDYDKFTEEIRTASSASGRTTAGSASGSQQFRSPAKDTGAAGPGSSSGKNQPPAPSARPSETRSSTAGTGKQQTAGQKRAGRFWKTVFVIIGIAILINLRNGGNKTDQKQTARSTKSRNEPRVTAADPTEPRVTVTEAPTAAARTERNWQSLMRFPSAAEIESCNRTATQRSPYIYTWMNTGNGLFTGYSVDFRAEYQPNGTYCCLGQFDLDYSGSFKNYRTESNGVAGYAGFQRLYNGELKAILSLWDVMYTDRSGVQKTHRATVTYPAGAGDIFYGEGTGAKCLTDYTWLPGKWYRMQLLCRRSETTGNTTIEMWVRDLSTSVQTKLCVYDLGVPNVCFKGDTALFLENFYPQFAGCIRTMECKNFSLYRNGWQKLNKGFTGCDMASYKGSYAYTVSGDTLCMITTGVEGKGSGQDTMKFNLR